MAKAPGDLREQLALAGHPEHMDAFEESCYADQHPFEGGTSPEYIELWRIWTDRGRPSPFRVWCDSIDMLATLGGA